ncbi:MAG: C1 family peptidase [Candidatus Omnitrophota bacterium]
MITHKIHGWIPDIPDQRDYLYSAIKPRLKLPKTVDISGYCSSVEDQAKLGSCTACAMSGNLEFLDNRPDRAYTDVSRLFIYYNERVLRGNEDYDSGASLRDGIKTLKKTGYCWESRWPYIISRFDVKPPPGCYLQASKHRIESYYRIHTLTEMLICLAQGYPFVFGFAVYESFQSKQVARTGKAAMPKKGERMLGGHAVLAVGYNQKEKCFLVRNSWGEKWGIHGYFTLPYEYIETLAADFWTIRK